MITNIAIAVAVNAATILAFNIAGAPGALAVWAVAAVAAAAYMKM